MVELRRAFDLSVLSGDGEQLESFPPVLPDSDAYRHDAGDKGYVARGVHHVGITVGNLDTSVAFWERLAGAPRFIGLLDRPYVGRAVGMERMTIRAAMFDLADGAVLELLEYQSTANTANTESTASVGNVHVCLLVDDIDTAWDVALSAGARPVSIGGPVAVDAGPNQDCRAAHLRGTDGVTVELFQRRESS